MAQEALEEFEKNLSCSMCDRPYVNPKVLQCQHVFCQTCLTVPDDDKLNVICGEVGCAQSTPIPDGGVGDLPDPNYISRLLDLMETIRGINGSQDTNCPTHKEEELKHYCLKCKEVMCTECGMQGNKHSNHKYTTVKEMFEASKQEYAKPLESMEEQTSSIDDALSAIRKNSMEVDRQQEKLKGTIETTMRELHSALHKREGELLTKLDQVAERKKQTLDKQSKMLETTKAQMKSFMEAFQKTLTLEKDGEVLGRNESIKKQLKDADKAFDHDKLTPIAECDMEFVSTSMITECQAFGQVHAQSETDPSACYLDGKGPDVAIVGTPSTVILYAIGYLGKPFEGQIESIEATLVSEVANTTTRGIIERKKKNQYKISYTTAVEGKHWLYIKVKGQCIGNGSPFPVESRCESAQKN
jgi:hypothetical protein